MFSKIYQLKRQTYFINSFPFQLQQLLTYLATKLVSQLPNQLVGSWYCIWEKIYVCYQPKFCIWELNLNYSRGSYSIFSCFLRIASFTFHLYNSSIIELKKRTHRNKDMVALQRNYNKPMKMNIKLNASNIIASLSCIQNYRTSNE